jgi:UDP-glucose 4-epimerase
MKILITGVAGLVGSNIAKSITDHKIIGIDNLIGGYKNNIPSHIEWINDDCNNLTKDHFENVDVVIHSACTAYEGLSIFSPKTITDNTFGNSMNVLKCSIQAGVKKFIYLSSMARYGKQDTVPFTEDMVPKPQDPYGVAKLAFEENLKILSKVHGFEYVILIPHNIIGPGQVYDDPFRNVASIMINRMLQNKQPVIYGDGNQMRCFSDIEDVIDPIKKIIFTELANNKIINIGPDSSFITINELALKIGEILNFKVDPIYMPNRPAEVKYANCSADLARDLLDYSPKVDLNTTLIKMVNWIKVSGVKSFNFNLPVEIINDLTPKTWINHNIFNS